MVSSQIYITDDFLEAYARVAKSQQKQVREFLRKLREDPASRAINYEKLNEAKDKNVRSVRISQAYRAIIVQIASGRSYILAYVDHHDEAYAWVRNKRFEVNQHTGALQILECAFEEVAEVACSARNGQLFSGISDQQLLECGVPEMFLPSVRNLVSEEDLDRMCRYLSHDVSEALYMLASGYQCSEVVEHLILNDSAAGASSKLVLLSSDQELERMLDAPLEKWRVFLHPAQRRYVEMDAPGPVLVTGGAGTGKSVVALHRVRHLAEQVFTGAGERILLTTFSRNLAEDLKHKLLSICRFEAVQRIDVINVDAWADEYLRQMGFSYNVLISKKSSEFWDRIWDKVRDLGFKKSFFCNEWEQVIQASDIRSLEQYLEADRSLCSRKLTQDQRLAVWPVFAEFRHLLDAGGYLEFADMVRKAAETVAAKGVKNPYRAVVVDEIQDMGPNALRLLRSLALEGKNDLFLCGDFNQRIYRKPFPMESTGIIIDKDNTFKLTVNYRTSEEIRKWAESMAQGLQYQYCKSLFTGGKPAVIEVADQRAEQARLMSHIQGLLKQGVQPETICIAARTNKLVDEYEEFLKSNGIACCRITPTGGDDRNQPGVRLSTMHRIKGLEFDYMVVAGVSPETMPLMAVISKADTEEDRKKLILQEKSLFYVALTRGRKGVLLIQHSE
ncbi:MAG: AAA family ATPase [Candidatus Wallbacteria bacterium]|nr:AAA family ATPase [Candidatus Wallbacteria bacterium]